MKSISNRLKDLRKENVYSIEELSEHLKVSSQLIKDWEKGKSVPDQDMFEQLAELYRIPIEDFTVRASDEKRYKKQMAILRYVISVLGMFATIIGMSLFLLIEQPYTMNLFYSVLALILSLLVMMFVKVSNRKKQYIYITVAVLVLSIAYMIPNFSEYFVIRGANFNAYSINDINYPITDPVEVVKYHDEFVEYALIYHEYEADIDVFNLTETYDPGFQPYTISTDGIVVQDLVEHFGDLYLSTFNDDLEKFQLYKLNLEEESLELLFENNNNFDMYEFDGFIYLVNISRSDEESDIYIYQDDSIHKMGSVDHLIDDMVEVRYEYQTMYMVSITDTEHIINGEATYHLGLFDQNFDLDHWFLEFMDSPMEFYRKDKFALNPTVICKNDVAIYKYENDRLRDMHINAPYDFYFIDDDYYAIRGQIYNSDFQKVRNFLYYDESFNRIDSAKLIIPRDGVSEFISINYNSIALGTVSDRASYHWIMPLPYRLIVMILSVGGYGYFLTLGQKKKVLDKNIS